MGPSNNHDAVRDVGVAAWSACPLESVSQFQVLSSQFDAEFGADARGIVVNCDLETGHQPPSPAPPSATSPAMRCMAEDFFVAQSPDAWRSRRRAGRSLAG